MEIKLSKLSVKALVVFAALGALSNNVAPSELKGSINRVGRPVVTTVYFYDNITEVQKQYRKIHKLPRDLRIGVQGFAIWAEYRDADGKQVEFDEEPHACVIHAVRPTKLDDEATKMLGHEMLHCLIGSYHP